MKYRLPLPAHRYFFGSDEPKEVAEIREAVERWHEVTDKAVLDCVVHKDPRSMSSGYREFAKGNISKGRREKLIESMKRDGIRVPLLIRGKGGILNGNHRNLIAIGLGYETVPTLILMEAE